MRLGPFDLTFQKRKPQRLREFGSASIQNLGDLLLKLEAYESDSNNKYITREMQVDETLRKYRGLAVKGNILLRNILETRSAFTAGRGLNTQWDGEDEQDFIKAFFRVNKIKLSYIRQLSRERGFEGQVLLVLQPHADKIPRVRFLSTRMNSHIGTPLFAGILDKLENLDDALIRLKTANKNVSNPTPYWEFEDESDAETFRDFLPSSGWTMGTALAGSGKVMMLQMGYGSYTALTEEVTTLAKIISRHTSVPSHYFGFSELVANRATADDISNAFVQVAGTETEEWAAGFTDLIGRAMAMYNRTSGVKLNTTTGEALIEVVGEEEFRRIAAIWLPLWLGGAITTPTFLGKIPTINENLEAEKVEAEIVARAGGRASGQAHAGRSRTAKKKDGTRCAEDVWPNEANIEFAAVSLRFAVFAVKCELRGVMKDPSSIQSVEFHFTPVDSHNDGLASSSAQTLTPPSDATKILLQALEQNVRFTLDGTAPTASKEFQLVAGDPPVLIPVTSSTTVKVIEGSATADLQYQWGK